MYIRKLHRAQRHLGRVLVKGAYSHEWGKSMRPQKKLLLHRVQGQVQQVLIKGTLDTGDIRFLEEEEYRKDGGSQSMFPKQQQEGHQRALLEIVSGPIQTYRS